VLTRYFLLEGSARAATVPPAESRLAAVSIGIPQPGQDSWNLPFHLLLFALLLFLGMLILLETGRRLAIRRRSKESEGERSSLGTVEGAVFALFGLMMAFTFSGGGAL
jgi:hypothetical protein